MYTTLPTDRIARWASLGWQFSGHLAPALAALHAFRWRSYRRISGEILLDCCRRTLLRPTVKGSLDCFFRK